MCVDCSLSTLPLSHKSAFPCFSASPLLATRTRLATCLAPRRSDSIAQLSRGSRSSIPSGSTKYSHRRLVSFDLLMGALVPQRLPMNRNPRAESPQCDSLGCSRAEPQVNGQADISSPERAKRGELVVEHNVRSLILPSF